MAISRSHVLLALVGVLWICGAARPPASVAKAISQALREKDDRVRAQLLENALRGVDSLAAADAILTRLLPKARTPVDTEIGVHALSRMTDAEAVAALGAFAQGKGIPIRRIEAIEALGRNDAIGASSALLALVHAASVPMRVAAVAALGARHEERQDIVLTEALDDVDWRVRSAAIWALARQGRDDAVPALAERMRREDGRLVDDCADALAQLTGRRLGARPDGYMREWAARTGQDAREAPQWSASPPSIDAPLLRSRSRRVLIVLSTGESMKDKVTPATLSPAARASLLAAGEDLIDDYDSAKTKMDLARVHAIAMLRSLRDGTHFDVAVYADSPTFAFGELVEASDRTRKKAESRIARLSPGGGSNLSEMLVRAFDPKAKDPILSPKATEAGPDTIVLFSDGRLAAPGIIDRNQVVMGVRRWNRVRQIRFVVVSLQPSDDSVLGPLTSGPPVGVSLQLP